MNNPAIPTLMLKIAVTLVNGKEPGKKRIGGYYKPWSSNSRKKIIFSLKRKKVLQLQVLF